MERPEFNRVLCLILTSFSSAPERNRDSPDSATASFFLSTFPSLQLSQILYMGGTIIPGIAALWENRGRKKEREGERQRERERERERERSVMWLLGFICHHNSHIAEMCSSIWRTKTTLPHYLFIPRPQNQNIFPRRAANLAHTDDIIQLFAGSLNSFMQELPLLIVSSYVVWAHCASWSIIQTWERRSDVGWQRRWN